MTLRLIRSPLAVLRSPLAMAPQQHHDGPPRVERLRGRALQSMRARVFARAGGLCECEECRRGYPKRLTLPTMELDHVRRIDDGGGNELANLRALHVDCHARITARQNAQRARYGCVLYDEPTQPPRPGPDGDDMPC